jgi:hypothetical protein
MVLKTQALSCDSVGVLLADVAPQDLASIRHRKVMGRRAFTTAARLRHFLPSRRGRSAPESKSTVRDQPATVSFTGVLGVSQQGTALQSTDDHLGSCRVSTISLQILINLRFSLCETRRRYANA